MVGVPAADSPWPALRGNSDRVLDEGTEVPDREGHREREADEASRRQVTTPVRSCGHRKGDERQDEE